MTEHVTITGYVTLEPSLNAYGAVVGGKLAKATIGKPYLTDDQRAIRLSVTVPTSVFGPMAEVAVVIPAELVSYPEVNVEAIE